MAIMATKVAQGQHEGPRVGRLPKEKGKTALAVTTAVAETPLAESTAAACIMQVIEVSGVRSSKGHLPPGGPAGL